MAHILVVDDEAGFRSFLAEALAIQGHAVKQAENGQKAIDILKKSQFHVVLSDLKMPVLDGMALLAWLQAEQPEVEVIMLTAHGSVGTAVEAMKLGAFDYLEKPLESPDALRLMVARAVERHSLRAHKEETASLKLPPLSYGAPSMKPVVDGLKKVAATDATLLLSGESGTGKELAARTVHVLSRRAAGPMVAVNCAALSDQLLESELFGHEKGAFTGAAGRRRGRIELANGGTCFLDEVGELKLETQTKLLRVLQERQFERVGGERTITVDVRWIAATNRDLTAMVKEGSFREDLFHRLAVFPVLLPPLRERRKDIPYLAETLLEHIGPKISRRKLELDSEARQYLEMAQWPGNIRELSNTLERAAILCEGRLITADLLQAGIGSPSPPNPEKKTEVATLAELEKSAIIQTLAAVDGNRKKTAQKLGIGLRTLYEKLKRYNIS